MLRLVPWFALASVAACGGKTETADTGPLTTQTTDTDTDTDTATTTPTEPTCSGKAPVIVDVTATNNGLNKDGDEPLPSMLFVIEASDDDGDLHEVSYQLWHDTTVDGSVDTAVVSSLSGSTDGLSADCKANGITLNLTVTLGGDDIPYDTLTEFAIEVADANGYRSAPFVLSATTPKADGSDGG